MPLRPASQGMLVEGRVRWPGDRGINLTYRDIRRRGWLIAVGLVVAVPAAAAVDCAGSTALAHDGKLITPQTVASRASPYQHMAPWVAMRAYRVLSATPSTADLIKTLDLPLDSGSAGDVLVVYVPQVSRRLFDDWIMASGGQRLGSVAAADATVNSVAAAPLRACGDAVIADEFAALRIASVTAVEITYAIDGGRVAIDFGDAIALVRPAVAGRSFDVLVIGMLK